MNAHIAVWLLLAVLADHLFAADYGPYKAPKRPIERSDFRIKDGCLFNVARSTQWERLGPEQHDLKVVDIVQKSIVIQEVWTDYIYGEPLSAPVDRMTRMGFFSNGGTRSTYRPIIGRTEMMGDFSIITNYPGPVKLGEMIERPYVVRIGTGEFRGLKVSAYDWGLANTPANRLTLTNAVLLKPGAQIAISHSEK
jgi:hypothetical protein